MFVRDFEDGEKRAFMALAEAVICADGVKASQEEQLLKQYAEEMGIDSWDRSEGSIVSLASYFGSRRARVSAYLELIALANADDDFDVREVQIIDQLREAFSISVGESEAMHSWVIRQTALLREAGSFMESGD